MSTPHKRKACKGTYKTNHYKGCGELIFAFKFGLCHACFVEWCYATGEGSEYLKKYVIPQAKKEVKKKERTKIKKQLQALETKTEVEKKLEKEINTIVRLIDKGHPCISSGRDLGKTMMQVIFGVKAATLKYVSTYSISLLKAYMIINTKVLMP
jgi:hypothetical protein